jgi:hypothetical protein
MAEKKAFLLRLPPDLHEQLQRLAAQELRSLNGQIEFLLRDGLRRRGINASESSTDSKNTGHAPHASERQSDQA